MSFVLCWISGEQDGGVYGGEILSVSLEATASGQGGRYINVTMDATDSGQEGHVFLVDVGDFFVKQLKTGERD